MSAWNLYRNRLQLHGNNARERALEAEKEMLQRKIGDSLSCFEAAMFIGKDGYCELDETPSYTKIQKVAIIDSDNLNEKYIFSMPGEDIELGTQVDWAGEHWLVVERDANNELYTRSKLLQCNYQLRWIDDNGSIYQQWCVIEDGTKYLTGEFEDRNFIVARGDSRIAMTISKNEKTVAFGRKNRFLIDDAESPHMLAYGLSKPLKLGLTYNGRGCYKFVLQEVTSTADDNHELRVADYYKHYPREVVVDNSPERKIDPDNNINENGRSVWL